MLFEKKIENLAIFGNGENHCKNTEFEKIVFNSKNVKKGDIFLPLKKHMIWEQFALYLRKI